MKIGIAIEKYGPHTGGCERSTHQIAEGLIARGHEVTIICNRLIGSADVLGEAAFRVGECGSTGRPWGLWRFSRWANEQLADAAFDVTFSVTAAAAAHVIEPRNGTIAGLNARQIAYESGRAAKAIRWLRNQINAKRRLFHRLERRHFHAPRCRRIVAISEFMAEQFRQHYGVPEQKLTIIRNGAELPAMDRQAAAERGRAMREKLGLDGDAVVFGFVGGDWLRKGLDALLRALPRVLRENPSARLVVAGTLAHAALELAAEQGVAQSVVWTGPTRAVADLYRAVDVLALPSNYDPASKVILEALMCGTPVIASACDGSSDWVCEPGRDDAGLVVTDPQDSDALAEAMIQMLDADRRAACAAAASTRRDAVQMDRHVAELEKVLTSIARSA